MSEGDYEHFYLGEVRVVQADQSAFLAYGDHLPGGVWIYRGQVHLESLLDPEVGTGARGRLTVTRWWALTRNLVEAPRRGNWKEFSASHRERESMAKEVHRRESSVPVTVPSGFTRR